MLINETGIRYSDECKLEITNITDDLLPSKSEIVSDNDRNVRLDLPDIKHNIKTTLKLIAIYILIYF